MYSEEYLASESRVYIDLNRMKSGSSPSQDYSSIESWLSILLSFSLHCIVLHTPDSSHKLAVSLLLGLCEGIAESEYT